MKHIRPTVTVAVAAYNEEGNIGQFLESVLMQKKDGFTLQEILVVSDGSTDGTVNEVHTFMKKSPKIRLIDEKKRIGKSSHLNTIYKTLSSDFLVQSDADVKLAHSYVIRDMIRPFLNDARVGMCGGNPIPVDGDSFWERMTRAVFEPYLEFRSVVRGGDNPFSAVGQLLSYRRDFAKDMVIPADMVTNDVYTYFCCLTSGWKYKFVPSAIVYFQSPRTLTDVLRQHTRFQTGYGRMYESFDPALVQRELHIPKRTYVSTFVRQCVKHPLYVAVYFIIITYCRVRARIVGRTLTAAWPMAKSTKKLNTVSSNSQ